MAKSTGAAPIDEDSTTHLEQAKKGKPRRFVLLCKGPQIVSLVLFKKGSIDKYKKQAKEAGTGQVFYGIVEGKGADVTFRLARADGFESEPTRAAVMKDFLAEHANLKCKPAFEIVDVLGALLDPEDPLHARLLKAQAAVPAAAQANPDRAEELRSLLKDTVALIDQDRRQEAEPKLLALEELLGRLKGSSPTTPVERPAAPVPPVASAPTAPLASDAPAAPPPATDKALANEFVQRFSKLKPRLDQALALGVPLSARVKEQGGIVAGLARKEEFREALALLEPFEGLIEQTLASQSSGPQGTGEPVPAGQPAAVTANQLLVALQKARLDWDTTRKAVQQALQQLEEAILESCKEEPDFPEIKANTKKLYVMLNKLDTRLGDKLDEALNAEVPQARAASQAEALSIAQGYLEYVYDDDLLNDIDDNGILRVNIQTRLLTTLHGIINVLLA